MAMLSTGAALQIISDAAGAVPIAATLQVLDLKQFQSTQGGTTGPRFRAMLSDGQHHFTAVLAGQLMELVNSGQLKVNSIVKLTEYLKSDVNGRKRAPPRP